MYVSLTGLLSKPGLPLNINHTETPLQHWQRIRYSHSFEKMETHSLGWMHHGTWHIRNRSKLMVIQHPPTNSIHAWKRYLFEKISRKLHCGLIAVSCTPCVCNHIWQSPRTIARCYWNKFEKFMFFSSPELDRQNNCSFLHRLERPKILSTYITINQ